MLAPHLRERGVIALQLFNEVGSLASTGFAALLLPDHWRLYLIIVSLPAAAVFSVALFTLSESPRWLHSRGRHAEASAVLYAIQTSGDGGVRLCCPSFLRSPPCSRMAATLASADGVAECVPSAEGGQGAARGSSDVSGARDLPAAQPTAGHAVSAGSLDHGAGVASIFASCRLLLARLCGRDLWCTTLMLSLLWYM
mgnify:CR=1 FL=1